MKKNTKMSVIVMIFTKIQISLKFSDTATDTEKLQEIKYNNKINQNTC